MQCALCFVIRSVKIAWLSYESKSYWSIRLLDFSEFNISLITNELNIQIMSPFPRHIKQLFNSEFLEICWLYVKFRLTFKHKSQLISYFKILSPSTFWVHVFISYCFFFSHFWLKQTVRIGCFSSNTLNRLLFNSYFSVSI